MVSRDGNLLIEPTGTAGCSYSIRTALLQAVSGWISIRLSR
jgi:hypothetical protein